MFFNADSYVTFSLQEVSSVFDYFCASNKLCKEVILSLNIENKK